MLTAPLPKLVDPLKMVDQGVELAGLVALSQFNRLEQTLLDNSGDVEVKLAFDKDEEGIRIITGSITADALMCCQRCLEPVQVHVDAAISLAMAFSEESAKNLPSYYDPLLLGTNELELWELVEDELILNLPIIALHPESECQIQMVDNSELEKTQEVEASPFAALASLKGKAPKSSA